MSILARISNIIHMAGVSNATVSRVTNGTAKVSEEKTKQMEEVIRKAGFNPNEIACSLYRKFSRLIGYIVPSILNIFLSKVGRATEDEAFHSGYKMIFCNSDESPEKEASYIRMLMGMSADGIIIIANNGYLEGEIRSYPILIILMDKSTDALYAALVQFSNCTGARVAAEHLTDCGCRRLVLMRGPIQYFSSQQRCQGYVDVCREYQIEPLFISSRCSYDEGVQSMRELFERYPDMDGILASTDLAALIPYKVLYEQHRKVLDDVMIMGHDDVGLNRLMIPALMTVAQPTEEIDRLCVQLIVEQTKHGMIQQRENMLPISLEIRETTERKEGV